MPYSLLLIVTGSIAAYKSLELVRLLRERGIAVTPVMTEGAKQFVTPLSLAALCEKPVYEELFSLKDETEMGHIRLAREHDAIAVVPASADFIAKMAGGRADDLASAVILASTRPVLVAPAMNPAMWGHAATQRNVAQLKEDGVVFLGPADGEMACGETGTGRLLEAAALADAIATHLAGHLAGHKEGKPAQPLAGVHALVTAGATAEPIDPVRFISNRSSGKQGHAIAAALAQRGAKVTLVTSSREAPVPPGVHAMVVSTAREMLITCQQVLERDAPVSLFVATAAVADWYVEGSATKLKKQSGKPPALVLKENPDILATISKAGKLRPVLCVGFAAETEANAAKLLQEAKAKRARKGCDWMVANDVTNGALFGAEDTQLHLLRGDDVESFASMSKIAAAGMLAERIAEFFIARRDNHSGSLRSLHAPIRRGARSRSVATLHSQS
ncbi:bifunctional phosphopantothenoylcysteine decarboxylase/phosphopantothenate--cysteine ligase CoaBC [bacterium]|nr:bifunctional phosphopantothenoylcysteine decarboxylase/phosphopantothenate--cysteine ligase CoaBC [bacterium]